MTGDQCGIAAERGYLQIGATRLSYLTWAGAGPPVLLLHGITSSAATLWQVGSALLGAVALLDPLLGIDQRWAGRVLPNYLSHLLPRKRGSLYLTPDAEATERTRLAG
jgi:pimeloyl-ACP methyl ester carboxylesterase